MKHKQWLTGLTGLTCVLFTACNSSSSGDVELEYLPVQLELDGKWAMIDGKGNLLFGEDFKHEPTAVSNGLFSVREGDDYTLYKAAAKPMPICQELVSVGVYREGLIPATPKKGRINLVDGEGKTKATLNPDAGKEITGCFPYFTEGMLLIRNEEGKFGYADKSGKIVIESKYEDAYPFSNGLAIVSKEVNEETVLMAIDKTGKEIFRFKKDIRPISYTFNEGFLAVKDDDGRCGFLDKKGEFNKTNGKVVTIGDFNSKYFAFMNGDHEWGVMDISGEQIIKPKYGSVNILADGNFFAKDDKDYIVLDKNGDKKLEISDYSYVAPIQSGNFNFIARDRSKYVLLDKNGKQVGKEEFVGVNTNPALGEMVTTDYFNTDAVVQSFVGPLTNGGYDKYRIGMSASDLGITDYSDYVYSSIYRDRELNKKGWRYEVDMYVNTDHSIASRDYDSYYNSMVVKNPDVKVESIVVSVETSVPCWKDIKDALIGAIQSKGYTVKENGDDWAEFTGKDCVLTISSSYSGITMRIKAANSSSYGEDVVVEAVDSIAGF